VLYTLHKNITNTRKSTTIMGSGPSRPNLPPSFRTKPLTKIDIATNEGLSGQPHFCAAAMQGWRAKMEDHYIAAINFLPGYSYFAVLDGHAGGYPAEQSSHRLTPLLAQNLRAVQENATFDLDRAVAGIEEAFKEMDIQLRKEMVPVDPNIKRQRGGTTVTSVLFTPDRFLFINCGDSRVVFSKKGTLSFETKDHKPNNPEEVVRIQCAGGFVARGRVNGTLAVSRSLGDFDYKPRQDVLQVSNVPDVVQVMRSDSDDFFVLASDGVWDVLRSRDACVNVGKHLLNKKKKITSIQLKAACKGVVSKSFKDGSYDNITAMIVVPNSLQDSVSAAPSRISRLETNVTIDGDDDTETPDVLTDVVQSKMTRSLTVTADFEMDGQP